LALELRRRAQACEAAGDAEGAKSLWKDSVEGLEAAKAKAPPGSAAARLLDRVLAALGSSAQGSNVDMETNAKFEFEVDTELERLIAELDTAVFASTPPAVPTATLSASAVVAMCRLGCKRPVCAGLTKEGKPFDTCCRGCAVNKAAGSHDATCQGGGVPDTRELAVPCDAVEVYGDGAGGGPQGSEDAAEEARAALRDLGLDDEWPTALIMREVRRRYMREALKCHPDKGPEEERGSRTERFQRLSSAYAMLELFLAMCEGGEEEAGAAPSGTVAGGAAAGSGAAAISDAEGRAVAAGEPLPPPSAHGARAALMLALPPVAEEEDAADAAEAAPPSVPLLKSTLSMTSSRSIFSCMLGTAPEVAQDTEEIRPDSLPSPVVASSSKSAPKRWPSDLF